MPDPTYTYGPEAGNSISPADAEKHILVQIAANTQGLSAGGTGGAGVVVASAPVTEHPVALGASASQVIPIGAKSWAAVLLTGTGTINGVAMPLNIPLSGGTLATTVTIATGTTSSAFVLYET